MKKEIHPVLTLRLYGEDKCFGPGISRLLHHVEQLHSLRAAANAMGMAYSKAWTILRAAQQELGFPLLNSTTGGKNGGGAVLTPQAKKLLTVYDAYCADLDAYANILFSERFGKLLAAQEE